MRTGILFPLPGPGTSAVPGVLLNLPFKRAVLHGGRHCPAGFGTSARSAYRAPSISQMTFPSFLWLIG
jgi:hypothetical protein